MTLYHITERSAWQAAQTAGVYTAPSLASEGFIHFSTEAQVLATAARFYRGVRGLVLLAIDEAQLSAPLRYEEGLPGELFPHLYGPLELSAVAAVYDFPPEPDGTFRLPTP